MLAKTFALGDDFPPVDYDAWRATVDADLKGAPFEKKLIAHTYEGIDILPLYTEDEHQHDSGMPGLAPFTRGAHPLGQASRGWDLRQEHAHPDLDVSNHAILDDLARGVSSIQLRLDAAARRGFDGDDPRALELASHDGVGAYTLRDFGQCPPGVMLEIAPIGLEAGAAFLPAAAQLAALWDERGVDPATAVGAFNADPLSILARDGMLPASLQTMLADAARLAAWTHERYPQVSSIRVGTAPQHHAGATSAQDLAFAMASGVEYLRALQGAGLSVDDASRQMVFSFGVGTHFFLAIAKLRAARTLWGPRDRGERRFTPRRGHAHAREDEQACPDRA
jgi:methylmalonyl-CoA mutase